MKPKTFVLSDESVNADGFRVLTGGIKLEDFLRNPVILGFHDREKPPIGRWENVRKEGGKLLADAVFDMNDPEAVLIAKKIEDGYLSATSIAFTGAKVTKDSRYIMAGQKRPTVVECVLEEASIVSVPSNRNALIQLCSQAGNDLEALPLIESNHSSINMKSVSTALGLSGDASEAEVLLAVKELQSVKEKASSTIPRLTTALAASKQLDLSGDSEAMKDMFVQAEVVMLSHSGGTKLAQTGKAGSIAEALSKTKAGAEGDEFSNVSIYELSKKDPQKLARLKKDHPERYEELYSKEFKTA